MKLLLGIYKTKIDSYDCDIKLLKYDDEEECQFLNADNPTPPWTLDKRLKRFLIEHYLGKEVDVSFCIEEIK
jgi:hypothetical protein